MLEYKVMRLPMSSQGTALFWSFLDLSQPWESLDRIYEGSVTGWSPSIGYNREVLAIPKVRLENLFRELICMTRLGFYPLTGLNPGLSLAFSLDITPSGDIFT